MIYFVRGEPAKIELESCEKDGGEAAILLRGFRKVKLAEWRVWWREKDRLRRLELAEEDGRKVVLVPPVEPSAPGPAIERVYASS
jgi:hypothetical protein